MTVIHQLLLRSAHQVGTNGAGKSWRGMNSHTLLSQPPSVKIIKLYFGLESVEGGNQGWELQDDTQSQVVDLVVGTGSTVTLSSEGGGVSHSNTDLLRERLFDRLGKYL